MNQQNHGTAFFVFLFRAPIWGQAPKGPQIEKWIPPTVFEIGPSIFFRDYWLPLNQQNRGTYFLFRAPFWGPKGPPPKGPKIEKWIPPTVFELGPSFFSGGFGHS